MIAPAAALGLGRAWRLFGLCVLAATAATAVTASASAQDDASGIVAEPPPITKAVELFNRKVAGSDGQEAHKDGFYLAFGGMVPGSGWIAAGPGYRRRVWSGRATVTASGALSWRLYSLAQVRVDVPRLASDRLSVGAQVIYQDALQVNYFGLGNDTTDATRSGYRLRSTDITTYGTVHHRGLTLTGRAGWVPAVALLPMAGRLPTYPSTERAFDEQGAPGITRQHPFAHADVSASLDHRDEPGHPTSGGLYRVSAAHYRGLHQQAQWSTVYEVEGGGYVPLAAKTWVLGVRAWVATTDTSDDARVPLYLLPNLGGSYTLRGYPDYRFTDRSVQLLTLESRWALFNHLDAAVFVDAGRTAHSVRKLGLSNLKASYGAGVRLHNGRVTILRCEVARGHDGWRVVASASEPMRRRTFTGNRTAVLPFVP